ncbi:general secretion pathway protein GspK [Starkeya sp. ORNL1]|uniref:general secretion pathway protein GspK n=1 Tax=Starkeya sp. ORNL1 TaxID=2709380 RepID=UPI001463D355|nr:type II secretion system protein GspK [Starkeya sp. ORNL1]QJP16353.1 general secretion pathway protein GspK [Starkeya sp. ORNL1]
MALIARSASNTDGFILVAVLWILAALATLVSVYAVYVSNTAMAAVARNDDLVAQGLVTAAVELAAYRVVSAPKDKRPTHGEVAFRMAKARIVAVFQSETARIDLNAASQELLAGLFTTLGAKAEDAEQYAARIITWRTPASAGAPDASAYPEAGLDYEPRGAPFVHVDELWLVAGLPPALIEQALPHLTVFSGEAAVHAVDADPVVLDSLPGVAERPTETLSADGSTGDVRAVARPGTTLEGGDAVRVTVRIDFDNGGVHGAEAVILVRDFGDDPYRVLSWRNDIELRAPEPRARAEAGR